MTRTAAALVIGNELLSGKIQEGNVAFLARSLFDLGIALRRVVICADDEGAIVDDVRALRAGHDAVFTSGGVGPTHDDITVPAIAKAFDRPLVRDPHLATMIRDHFGDATTEGHLRMADLPEGGELLASASIPWPVIRVENVFVMPGVPEIFRLKLALVLPRLERGTPFVTRAIYTRCDEGEIAALLARIEHDHPGVRIGSYPRFRDPDHTVKLTFDGIDLALVTRALRACLEALPPDRIVRAEID
jgi:molybdenum cofactor synthesis domain-containing protein